jgi:uncharacterized protein (DUF362 family)
MAKGASIKFESFSATVPSLLEIIKLEKELKNHDKIVIKTSLLDSNTENSNNVSADFAEAVLKYVLEHRKPNAEVFIAEGADGYNTGELFNLFKYNELAEKYSIGLVDLNNAETQELEYDGFLKFKQIEYPSLLKDSFVISLAKAQENPETLVYASLPNMLGAFSSKYYSGLFSKAKSKIRKWPIKFSIHDSLKCKMPNLAIIDASQKGLILAGVPLDVDKKAASLLGKDWKAVPYLRLVDEAFSTNMK